MARTAPRQRPLAVIAPTPKHLRQITNFHNSIMKEKINVKINPYLHFVKLVVLDIVIIWTVGFCIIFTSSMIFGAGAASLLLPNLYALISVTFIWIIATLPFIITYKTFKRNDIPDLTKLKNYKWILLLNTVLFIVFVTAIIMTPL